MTARRRMAILAVIAVLLTGGVGGLTTYSLYHAAVTHHGEFLEAVVRTQQTLAAQIFLDELSGLGGDTAAAIAGTLAHLRSANRQFVGFGTTGEFTVARLVGDTIRFEIGLRGDAARLPAPVILPSPLATPTQKALRGDTGVSEERDYVGARVLAAYGPIPGTGLAVTAKIDLWEIRRPHVRAAFLAGPAAAVLLLVALLSGRSVARSVLAEVEEREDAHQALLGDFPGIIFRAVGDARGEWRLDVVEGAVEEITGMPARDLGGTLGALRPMIHEQDLQAFDSQLTGFGRGEADLDPTDYRLVRPDGRQVWVRVNARAHGGPGQVGMVGVAVSGVVLDVTAERRALEVRARAEAELHALVRHLPRVAVHILDRDLRYRYSGGQALSDVGLTHEDLVGKRIADVLDPEMAGKFAAMYERVLAGDTGWLEGSLGGHDFEVTAAPLRGSDGSVDRILVLSLDVTDARRLEVEAAATEARFQAFMQASPAVAWLKDAEGRFLWVNRAWEEAFGLSRAAWEGTTEYQHLPAALADEAHAHDLEVLRTGRPLAVVEDTGELGGVRRVWQTVKFPVAGAAGETLVGGIAVDITRERDAESARRESEYRLRVAVKAGGHGLWDLDVRTGAAQVDEIYASMLGYDPAGFVETNAAWRDRLHPDDRAVVYGEYEAYVAGARDVYRVEFRSRTAQGGWRWILSQGEIVERDAEGRPVRMMGTHTDIQALKDAEAALRESEDRFRRAVEASPVAIFIHTAGRFAYLNPAALSLFGAARPEQLLGQPVLERHADSDRGEVAARIRTVTEEQEPAPHRVGGVVRLDGSEAQAEFTGVPFRYLGEDAGLVFAHDVTERLAAEGLIQAQMAELRRWQGVMLDREDRVQELKREVNELCRRAGQPPRYAGDDTGQALEGPS